MRDEAIIMSDEQRSKNEQRNASNAANDITTSNDTNTGAHNVAQEPVISVRDLTVSFASEAGTVHAVRGMNFDLYPGKTLGIVGESGSGKSTTLMEIMEFKQPQEGEIEMFGTKLEHKIPREKRRELRSAVQYVFQDPMSSLDPRPPIYDILAEPMKVQHYSKERIRERIGELMRLVELNPDQVDRFPTQFSGGQRQRIAIARALSVNPKLVLLDEPVSALNVSIQAGVINLLEDLQNKLGVAYLFVAHNLSVVRHISSRVAVMYLGRIVESGDTEDVFEHPLHPYTQALISAVPVPDPKAERTRKRIVLEGEVPSPTETFEGCPFMGRCPLMPKHLAFGTSVI